MRSTKNRLHTILVLLATSPAMAAQVTLFDSPLLVVERQGNSIRGHYGASTPNFSCDFYFFGNFDTNQSASIRSFTTLTDYKRRDKSFDINGRILIDSTQNWSISLDDEPPGCGGAAGRFKFASEDSPTNSFKSKNPIIAPGIQIANKKTVTLDKEHHKRKSLSTGSSVLVLKFTSTKAFIQHQPLDGSPEFKGWLNRADLSSPFTGIENESPSGPK